MPPSEAKVHPIVGLKACQDRKGHGYALWVLARSLGDGSGKIEPSLLRQATVELRWPIHQWRRAVQQAAAGGMLAESGGLIWITSLEKVCRSFGLISAGNYPVMVPTAAMRRLSAWKSALWSAYHASRGERVAANPISREALERQTGVNARTQRRLDRKAKVKLQPTFKAVTSHPTPPGYIDLVREDNRNWRCFEKDGYVWMQGSNIYTSNLVTTRRGMSRKIRARLRNDLLSMPDEERPRLYFDQQKSAEKSLRQPDKGGRPSGLQPRFTKTYYRAQHLSGGTVLFLPTC